MKVVWIHNTAGNFATLEPNPMAVLVILTTGTVIGILAFSQLMWAPRPRMGGSSDVMLTIPE
jgi:hypothetical protein